MAKTPRYPGLLIALSCACFAAPARAEAPARIRVRLDEVAAVVPVRGFDLRIGEIPSGAAFPGAPSRALAATPDRLSHWELRCQGRRIRATRLPGGQSLELASPVQIETPAGFLSYRGRPYRDRLIVHASGSACEVVNEVDIEEYLSGLVNSEFSSKWSPSAIDAQVVAARTYALHQIRVLRKTPGSRFDVDATTKDQVYDGSMKEDFRASRAVDRTRGLVLTDGGKSAAPLKAFYHSTCGGMTELPERVWGKPQPGFRRRVKCGFCESSPRFRWELELDSSSIAEALRSGVRVGGVPSEWPKNWPEILGQGKLAAIRVESGPNAATAPATAATVTARRSSRVILVWQLGVESHELPLASPRFREWIGSTQLRSTAFQVTSVAASGARSQRWRFTGWGNGHGVGMCQWGAKIMGDQGRSMTAILKHYYPDARLARLW